MQRKHENFGHAGCRLIQPPLHSACSGTVLFWRGPETTTSNAEHSSGASVGVSMHCAILASASVRCSISSAARCSWPQLPDLCLFTGGSSRTQWLEIVATGLDAGLGGWFSAAVPSRECKKKHQSWARALWCRIPWCVFFISKLIHVYHLAHKKPSLIHDFVAILHHYILSCMLVLSDVQCKWFNWLSMFALRVVVVSYTMTYK